MIAQVRAELLRQRSTLTTFGLFAAMLALIALAVGLHAFGLPATTLAPGANQLMVVGVGERLGVLFAALAGAVAITGDYRHGTIRPRLLAAPRRGQLVAAKVAVSALLGVGFGLAGTALAALAAGVLLNARGVEVELSSGDYTLLIVGGALAGGLWATIGLAVGALLRNQVPALVGIAAWLLFVEGLLVEENSSVIAIGKYAPGAAAAAIAGLSQGTLLSPAPALALLALYAAAATVVGWLATTRRDIP